MGSSLHQDLIPDDGVPEGPLPSARSLSRPVIQPVTHTADDVEEAIHELEHDAWEPQKEPSVGELSGLLQNLEANLANPINIFAVASAYRRLTLWSQAHGSTPAAAKVLRELDSRGSYPAWRRQALEEAYALFYDEVAQTGDPTALRVLLEPPTSEQMGFRPLPEALANRNATAQPSIPGSYEDGSMCLRHRKWEYAIERQDSSELPTGRAIVHRGVSDRYCQVATDPVSRALQAILGKEACCAKPREKLRGRWRYPAKVSQ